MKAALALLPVLLDPTPPAPETTAAGAVSSYVVAMNNAQSTSDLQNAQSQQVVAWANWTWHQEPVCEWGGTATCDQLMMCPEGTPVTNIWAESPDGTRQVSDFVCPEEPQAAEPVVITASMALRALRRVPLPPSVLQVQPPDGRTLVNFETNFFTEAEPFERTVRLLGQRVDLRIRPTAFTWHFGDGTTTTTSEPGAPYPHLEVTHAYLRRGQVSPSVDTTYGADFRVNGGPWQPVDGTVTMTGAPETLEVLTARPTLVGYTR